MMGVDCPACGSVSRDAEFCDHCNADLRGPAGHAPPPEHCPLGGDGVRLYAEQRQQLDRPEAFLHLLGPDGPVRVHWIAPAAVERRRKDFRKREKHQRLTCLPNCRWIDDQGGAWVVAGEAGVGPAPWTAASNDPYENLERLQKCIQPLAAALEELHAAGLVCLTFDPGRMEWTQDGKVRFANMDLRVYGRDGFPDRLPLRSNYAAPEVARFQSSDIGPRADVFHLALFCYYWLAGLLPEGFPGSGLEAFWYQIPPLRVYAPLGPPGLAHVLEQGLAVEPARRFAAPHAFVSALADAAARCRKRRDFKGALDWDIGMHTRAGRTKSASRRDNEDHVLVRRFDAPPRALVAVADGITTCDVGSGALASLISTIILESAFDSQCTAEKFPLQITAACQHGARTLLDWAMEKGYKEQLAEGADLMGTTLTAGWLEGSQVVLANLGDSRAYLIDDQGAEQLTVDGDLGSGMLASGVPPEEVHAMGIAAKSLRECIGGCAFVPGFGIAILEESCHPAIVKVPLVPGDILVLCSDGLVEEGAFLEPQMLADLVHKNRRLSANDLATLLADSADALQRLPSAEEPDGFGDNISCIVVKIQESGIRSQGSGISDKS
ncbi:MAG: protein phosphatase 2C domain-containing protein [Gemmataceae bacterium]|nr:protein phosphatase 2C domain-containing protein [Gemmataceae bacterium]